MAAARLQLVVLSVCLHYVCTTLLLKIVVYCAVYGHRHTLRVGRRTQRILYVTLFVHFWSVFLSLSTVLSTVSLTALIIEIPRYCEFVRVA